MKGIRLLLSLLSVAVLCFLAALCLKNEPPQVLFALGLAVAIHEAGHICAIASAGLEARRFLFLPFGAIIDTGTRTCGYMTECGIYMAGPMAGFLTAALFLWHADPAKMNVAFCYCIISVGLSSFNLLPLPGLDGEGALRAVLLHFSEDGASAIRAVRVVRAVFAVGFFLVAGALWLGWGMGEYPLLLAVFFLLRLF